MEMQSCSSSCSEKINKIIICYYLIFRNQKLKILGTKMTVNNLVHAENNCHQQLTVRY